jgi:protein-disulfide isomerase
MAPSKLVGLVVDVAFLALGVTAAIVIARGRPGHTHPTPLTVIGERVLDTSALPTLGSSTAPLFIIEFSDFDCSFCRKHARDTWPELKRELVDTGRARYAFAANPLERIHPTAAQLAAVAFCADEHGQFWELRDSFFRERPLDDVSLANVIQSRGLDASAVLACATKGARGHRAIELQRGLAVDWKLTGTPSFLVGRSMPGDRAAITVSIAGSQPVAVFRQALEAVLRAGRR